MNGVNHTLTEIALLSSLAALPSLWSPSSPAAVIVVPVLLLLRVNPSLFLRQQACKQLARVRATRSSRVASATFGTDSILSSSLLKCCSDVVHTSQCLAGFKSAQANSGFSSLAGNA